MTRDPRTGFTLMELVVAIMITGVIAAMGYGTFTSILDHRAVVRKATTEMERAAAFRETLYEWLTRGTNYFVVHPPKRVASILELAMVGNVLQSVSSGESYSLAFTTRSVVARGVPRTQIWLFIDDDPATPERGLTMRYSIGDVIQALILSKMPKGPEYDAAATIEDATAIVTRELEPTVKSMRVEFLDPTNRWRRADGLGRVNPEALDVVAIRLTLEGTPDAPLLPLLRLPLVVSVEDPVARWTR